MPSRINGFGTTYSSRNNEHSYVATCTACGREDRLSAFDTQLSVSLLFIPVVPLKALRVFNYCSQCTRHVSQPQREWRETLDDLVARLRVRLATGTPDDLRGAFAGLTSAGADVVAWNALRADLERCAGDDPHALRVFAAAQAHFGEPRAAVATLERALGFAGDEAFMHDAHGDLARLFALLLEPERAERFVEDAWRAGWKQGVAPALLVIEAHQQLGEHGKAKRILEHLARAYPNLAGDSAFAALVKISARDTKQPTFRERIMRLRYPDSAGKIPMRPVRATTLRDRAIGVAVAAAFGLLVVGGVGVLGSARQLYVVTGVPHEYDVTIDGTAYHMAPGRHLGLFLHGKAR